ncbi:lipopolysaccharide biosynthesis protein [Aliivibrio salmonicida]|uniref:lipopolysaccharide biosynthesis protein n=1 Tax=Aliivibrio salmonicida TaxID=40269 RepID=UPI00406C30B2
MFKQIVKLISSSLSGQAINLAVFLIMARLILPIDIGTYLLGLTVTTYILVLASAKYHHAIFVMDEGDAEVLTFGSKYSCAFISLLSVVTLTFINQCFNLWPSLSVVNIILIGMAGYFSATNLFYYYLALKKNQLNKIMYSRTLSPLFGGVVMISLAWFFKTSEALLTGYVFTLFLANYFIFPRNCKWIGFGYFFDLLKRNKQFPVILLPAGMLETLNASYLIMAVTSIFGVESAAYIGMYYRLVASPQGMICTAVSDIYRKKVAQLSEQGEEQNLIPFFFKSLVYLSILSLFASIGLYVFSIYGIDLILGDEWSNIKQVFISLIPMFAVTFIISPVASILYVREGQKFDLIVQVVFIMLLFVYHFLAGNKDLNDFVFGFSLIVIIKYMLELFFCYKCISQNKTKCNG